MRKYNFVKDIIIFPKQVKEMGYKLHNEIREFYKDVPNLVIIIIMNGGIDVYRLIFSSLSMPMETEITRFLLSVKSYGDKTTSDNKVVIKPGSVEMQENMRKSIEGCPVLIIDNIHDTGETLKAVAAMIKEKYSPSSIECCVMIERVLKNHPIDRKMPRFIGWFVHMPDFLVGCGLDYKENYRFLPYVATVLPDFEGGIYEEHICNKCGNTCESSDEKESVGDLHPTSYGLIDGVVSGHYFSPALEDCTSYKFDLCEKCLIEIFNSFVILAEERECSPWA